MADPLNPNPTNPGGTPLDPGTADQVNRSMDRLRSADALAATYKKQADEAARTSNELDRQFKAVQKEVDAYKELTKLMKQKAGSVKTEWRDAIKARQELERIVELHEEALKNSRAGTKEFRTMTDHLGRAKKLLDGMPKSGQLLEEHLHDANEMMREFSMNIKDVAKALAGLGRTGASLRGLAGIMESLGGPNIATGIDRRLEKFEQVRDAVAASKQLRQRATTTHMKSKRAKAIDEMRAQHGAGGLSVDPDTGNVMSMFDEGGAMTSGGRHSLASKMGFKMGTDKYKKFISGEAAGGEAAGGAEGAGWAGAMAEGGGAMEGLSTVIEGATDALMDFAPEIAILIEVIKVLTEIFGAYTKQNQEMEKGLGKGGLFTQPGMGPGEAFGVARGALLPGGGHGLGMMAGAGLGINWERNLAMAGQLSQSGMSVFPGMTGADVANQKPGSMGEFMRGGVGEMQRIVMGAGRVGGLTDQEGIGEVIKLLGEYRETIASSEEFMARLNKDTAAAGISTTKYLKIIDEVSGAFDKMGKSLEQVTGVMRELSRYGAISSDSLKDMMEFLEAGQQKTNTGNMATAAFTQAIMDPKTLKSLRETEQQTLQNYVEAFNAEGKDQGFTALDISAAINKGDYSGAQGMANKMRGQINNLTDPTVKQNMTDSLAKVQEQINRVAGVMSPDFLKRASSQGMYKEDPAQTIAALFTNLKYSASQSGTTMKSLMEGGGSASQQVLVQQLSEMLGVKAGGYANAFQMMRQEASNRVLDVQQAGNDKDRKALGKQIFSEFYKGAKNKKGLETFLNSQGMGKYLRDTYDATVDAMLADKDSTKDFTDMANANLDAIADSSTTQDKILKANASGNKIGADALADQISTARGIALRTQSVGDILANTFKPLLIKTLSVLEGIATVVSKWFSDSGGDDDVAAKTEQQKADEMAGVGSAIDSLNKQLDTRQADLRKFQKDHTDAQGNMTDSDKQQAQTMAAQTAIAADTLTKLSEIQNTGAFTSGAQESLVMDAIKKIQGGQNPELVGAGFKGVTINQYYSSDSTQAAAQPANVGTSSDKAPNVKIAPASRQRRPMDDK